MLRRLPAEGLDSLLALYNKIWHQGYFPEKWLESTIIPILKPWKDSTNPSIYHPFAISSVVCKVMERMLNVRLLDFFDHEGTLLALHCEGRAK